MKIRILSILLLLVLLLTACQSSQQTSTTLNNIEVDWTTAEGRSRYSNFILGQVLVTMTNEASLQFVDYTPEHFPELQGISVYMRPESKERKEKMMAVLRGEKVDGNYDPSNYYATFTLHLEDRSPAATFQAVEILENRDDILGATPNYIGSVPETSTVKKTPRERWGNSDFTNDAIIVQMTNEASLQFLDYTPEDFSEIGCVKVEEWSPLWLKWFQASAQGVPELEYLRPDLFERRLVLYLEDQTRDNVFQALATIEQREDIARARPNLT